MKGTPVRSCVPTQGFEIREYPESVWVCTKGEVDPKADPMNDWEKRFDSPFDAMSSAEFEDTPNNDMFMRLFKYIVGVNKEAVEIEMTRPVTTKKTPRDDNGLELHEMCFWTGTPWVGKELPEPIDEQVYIQKREKMVVFVRYIHLLLILYLPCPNQEAHFQRVWRLGLV